MKATLRMAVFLLVAQAGVISGASTPSSPSVPPPPIAPGKVHPDDWLGPVAAEAAGASAMRNVASRPWRWSEMLDLHPVRRWT